MTDYKKRPISSLNSDPSLPDILNNFYARFEKPTSPVISPDPILTPPFCIQEDEVRTTFKRLKIRKAAGPDGISPALLSHCAAQLAPVFSTIFNTSLSQCTVPQCFKCSIIIPVPKSSKITCLNDFRPVALTSVVMKAFEQIILAYLKSCTSLKMDSYQFAYQANRSVEDAISIALHHTLQHLESPNTYTRILFIDFSSAFNTINPFKLFTTLLDMNIDPAICHWIRSFLWNRSQRVKVNNITSDPLTLSTGAPQGCVLSPWLFSLYTSYFRSMDTSVKIIKYADDTTIVGLISDNDETQYRMVVDQAVNWCSNNDLQFNTAKTQELIVDFRRRPFLKPPIQINGNSITITDSFKFLGTHISNNLKWTTNTNQIIAKAQQRLYFLRQLKKYRIRHQLLVLFYSAIIESIITSSITVWYGSTDSQTKKKLQQIVNKASKIIGKSLPSVDSLYTYRTVKRAKKIISDPSHPANHLFQLLPSGRRYRSLSTKTKRFINSFFPIAIRTLNSSF